MTKRASFFLLIFLILLIAFVSFNRGILVPILTQPTPIPTPFPEELVPSPSVYATDEAVLKIESKLELLEKDFNMVDLEELRLRPPVFDLKVEY